MLKSLGEFDPPKIICYALIVSVPNSRFQDENVLRCIEKFRENNGYERLDTETEYESDGSDESESDQYMD